jgi:hypothetical protein
LVAVPTDIGAVSFRLGDARVTRTRSLLAWFTDA